MTASPVRPVPGTSLDGRGLAASTIAFAIWGVFPLYLKPLGVVPALEVMAHRVAWCCVFVLIWLGIRGELGTVREALADADTRRRLLLSTSLISINWFTYVWAVGNGHVIESSLGYFINPLLNVMLGVVVLKERLNRAQWVAVGFAVAGVAYLTAQTGRLPWIALLLACS
ncbi:MAG TPA: EamA family transporter RarD, partial [Steroidobacteraceae bacterium]|nr:EamA family transporter RarD [Steroidobacteraceae bacterium]